MHKCRSLFPIEFSYRDLNTMNQKIKTYKTVTLTAVVRELQSHEALRMTELNSK